MKKEWLTPKLIVMVRSKPEEAVLSVCKDALRVGPFTNPAIRCNAQGNQQQCSLVNIS